MTTKLLDEIIPAIIAFDLQFAGVDVTSYGLDQLPNSIAASMLPCRIISPYTGRNSGNVQRWVTLAHNKVVDWQLTDLTLIRGAAAGTGLAELSTTIATYQSNYIDAVQALRGYAKWKIQSFSLEADMIEWPESSGQWYDGVRSQLTIRELQ